MKTTLKFLLLASSLLALNACTDVVQVKLDQGSKLYVIDAFVNNLPEQQLVRVVANDNYFSSSEPPAVTNANVVLRDLNANKDYIFSYTSNGYYAYTPAAGDTIGKVNHQYQLSVTIDGATYTSLSIQKRAAVLDSIVPKERKNNGGFGGGQGNDTTYSCTLFARDVVDQNIDYYRIKTFRNDTLFNAPSDINVCIDGTGGSTSDAGVDTLPFSEPATLLGFKRYRKNATCTVEIHSITRDTYFFFVQAGQQINNGGLFATTPENVKTNILTPKEAKIKAIGWFSMASVVARKIVVK